LLGGINGSKQTGTETKTQAPWTPQQPYLTDMFAKAKAASDSGAASPYETSALQGLQGFANGPKTNPLAGVDNPYLTQTINNASQDAMRNLMPMYDQAQRASGSFGNSGVTEAFGRTAADTLGKIAPGFGLPKFELWLEKGSWSECQVAVSNAKQRSYA
jgi:hypothetical protein